MTTTHTATRVLPSLRSRSPLPEGRRRRLLPALRSRVPPAEGRREVDRFRSRSPLAEFPDPWASDDDEPMRDKRMELPPELRWGFGLLEHLKKRLMVYKVGHVMSQIVDDYCLFDGPPTLVCNYVSGLRWKAKESSESYWVRQPVLSPGLDWTETDDPATWNNALDRRGRPATLFHGTQWVCLRNIIEVGLGAGHRSAEGMSGVWSSESFRVAEAYARPAKVCDDGFAQVVLELRVLARKKNKKSKIPRRIFCTFKSEKVSVEAVHMRIWKEGDPACRPSRSYHAW